jgi:tetratricopeptide (TPR) repeat protein
MNKQHADQRMFLNSLLQVNELRLEKKFETVISLCEDLITVYRSNEYLSSIIAQCYFMLGSTNSPESQNYYQKAITWISKAIELSPENPSFHADLGEYYWLGLLEYQKAAYEFKKALELNPQYVRALLGIAALYGPPESIVTLNEAIKYLQAAIKIEPDNPNYQGRLGQLYIEKGSSLDGEREWLKGLQSAKPIDPGYIQLIKDYLVK